MTDRAVYFAKLTRAQTGAFDKTFQADLLEALDPSHEATRYRKQWRLSRPQLSGRAIVGKLGFVRTARASETRYDDDLRPPAGGGVLGHGCYRCLEQR